MSLDPTLLVGSDAGTVFRNYQNEDSTPAEVARCVARLTEFFDILWEEGPWVDDGGRVYYEAILLSNLSPGEWLPALGAESDTGREGLPIL